MVIAVSAEREDLETLSVKVHLTGLTTGQLLDVYRMQIRYTGKDSSGTRTYARELPDRLALYSSLAHRVKWPAPGTTANFRDYEAPKRPFQYFVVPSSAEGPHEFDFADGNYPLSRGVLSPEIVHFNQDIRDTLGADVDEGHVLVRSTHELAHYAETCLVEMDGPTYTARVNEHAVMGNPYPVVVADSREARRGSVTLLVRNLGQYNALRRIVFPASGRIRPVLLQSGGDAATLLDDMRIIPLDVDIEQATPANADMRFVTIDYVEADPSAPLIARSGDLDTLSGAPEANFTISDSTPAAGAWVTLTNTSTGTGSDFEWTVDNAADNKIGKFFTAGPHQVRFFGPGRKSVKLRFGGPTAGYHTRTKFLDVL